MMRGAPDMDIPTRNFQCGVRQWDEELRFTGPFWHDNHKPEKPPPRKRRRRPQPENGAPSIKQNSKAQRHPDSIRRCSPQSRGVQ
jgi:hypothetical protein